MLWRFTENERNLVFFRIITRRHGVHGEEVLGKSITRRRWDAEGAEFLTCMVTVTCLIVSVLPPQIVDCGTAATTPK